MATLLQVTGLAASPRAFDFQALAALPGQLPDVSAVLPGREGGGVRLTALLDAVRPLPNAGYLTLEATDGSFSASIPLKPIRDQGIILYRLGDGPLPAAKGGPVRFFIADAESCGLAEVDACANVKFLGRIDLSEEPGRDLRPATQQAHEALHEHETGLTGGQRP